MKYWLLIAHNIEVVSANTKGEGNIIHQAVNHALVLEEIGVLVEYVPVQHDALETNNRTDFRSNLFVTTEPVAIASREISSMRRREAGDRKRRMSMRQQNTSCKPAYRTSLPPVVSSLEMSQLHLGWVHQLLVRLHLLSVSSVSWPSCSDTG